MFQYTCFWLRGNGAKLHLVEVDTGLLPMFYSFQGIKDSEDLCVSAQDLPSDLGHRLPVGLWEHLQLSVPCMASMRAAKDPMQWLWQPHQPLPVEALHWFSRISRKTAQWNFLKISTLQHAACGFALLWPWHARPMVRHSDPKKRNCTEHKYRPMAARAGSWGWNWSCLRVTVAY